jgi:hypothetical protein
MKTVNYFVSNAELSELCRFSFMKLLDWRIGSAVVVNHDVDVNTITILSCPSELGKLLAEKLVASRVEIAAGGVSIEDAEIADVLKIVGGWVNR